MSKSYPEEFIGRRIKVIQASNNSLKGTEGTIIDDTKNTFKIINDKQEEKILLKQGCVFLVDNKEKVQGKDLLQRPEERIKPRK
ncbi:ribonuclease P protein subunit [Candidatus Woesearchaeota archaeon]|nr:ribonuclease P protein subunit [Candidatus Woesearchaeota archaeon]